MTLSDVNIRKTKATNREFKLFDGKGLYVRCYPSGRKVFVFRYTISGRTRWMELGDYPLMSLTDARQKAAESKAKVRNTIDPIEEFESEKIQKELQSQQLKKKHEIQRNTVSKVAHDYYKRHVDTQFKCPGEWMGMLNKNILPFIGDIPVKEVKRSQIAHLLNAIVDRGSRVRANRTLAVVKQIFRYAVEQGHIDASPAAIITRKSVGGTEASRERALTFEDISHFWHVLDDLNKCAASWQTQYTFKWLLLTGQRVGETLLTEWTHIDWENRLWNLPKENTKAERQHTVHLSNYAIQLLTDIKPLSGESKYIFPSPSNPQKPITVRSVSRTLNRLFERNYLDMEIFTPHDIRRSVATRLGDLKIPPHVIEKILNHKMTGVMAVYNRQEYMPERTEALDNWSSSLQQLVENSNVVYLSG